MNPEKPEQGQDLRKKLKAKKKEKTTESATTRPESISHEQLSGSSVEIQRERASGVQQPSVSGVQQPGDHIERSDRLKLLKLSLSPSKMLTSKKRSLSTETQVGSEPPPVRRCGSLDVLSRSECISPQPSTSFAHETSRTTTESLEKGVIRTPQSVESESFEDNGSDSDTCKSEPLNNLDINVRNISFYTESPASHKTGSVSEPRNLLSASKCTTFNRKAKDKKDRLLIEIDCSRGYVSAPAKLQIENNYRFIYEELVRALGSILGNTLALVSDSENGAEDPEQDTTSVEMTEMEAQIEVPEQASTSAEMTEMEAQIEVPESGHIIAERSLAVEASREMAPTEIMDVQAEHMSSGETSRDAGDIETTEIKKVGKKRRHEDDKPPNPSE